jgi:hypothetical protein
MGYFKCWICKDQGMIIYSRDYRGIDYEMAARCSCIKGQQLGERIPIISEGLAIKFADANYNKYKESSSQTL